MEQLTQAQHKAAEALYKQAGRRAGRRRPRRRAVGGGPAAAGGRRRQGDVIDAEVVEDEKKLTRGMTET